MIDFLQRQKVRRGAGQTGSQTDGNTGRKPGTPTRVRGLRVVGLSRLAGFTPRNLRGSRPHPPANAQEAQRKFGKRIENLRRKFGLSQEGLSNYCGVSPTKMQKIESGDIDPDLFLMIRLSDRFGIKPDRLLRGIK